MMLHRFVLLRCKPTYPIRIFTPYTLAPRELIVYLDKVVTPQNGGLGLYPPEEVGHWFFEFVFEAVVVIKLFC
jgi:hypothetical protein